VTRDTKWTKYIELRVQTILEKSVCGLFKIRSQNPPVETAGSNLNVRTASFLSGYIVGSNFKY
jgi:hypothetical protein